MSAPFNELSDAECSDFIDAKTLKEEFPALKGIVYVDHAATTLVSRTQLDGHTEDILNNVYGNPHSHSPSSQLATDSIDQVRYRILKFFNTSFEEYTVIFTAGCTASLKLLGESFSYHGNQEQKNLSENVQESRFHHGRKSTDISPDLGPYKGGIGNERIGETKHGLENVNNDVKAKLDGKVSHKTTIKSDGKTSISEQKQNIKCHESTSYRNTNLNRTCSSNGSFTYLLDNHTSVQGMRELAFKTAGKVQCIDCDEHFNFILTSQHILKQDSHYNGHGNHLFVYPAQSNFNGTKYPLEWVSKVKDVCFQWQQDNALWESCNEGGLIGNWYVCMDAASLVSTSPLDLGKVKPDFVSLSFYKMFGFPTGLGALIVKNSSAHVLKKTYYGGGTVSVSLPCKRFHVSRSSLSERFEDGTLPFLDIIALKHGFDALTSLAGGISKISQHTFTLAHYFHHSLSQCHHGNGAPLAVVYSVGDYTDVQTQGGIVNFNLLRPSGEYVGFAEVDKLAQLFQIHLRTGCFCNIGACQKFLHLSDDQIKNNFESGHVCGDNNDLIDGKPTGSVRISFGYMSTLEDVQKCLQFIVDCFLQNTSKPLFWIERKETQSVEEKSVDANNSSYSKIVTLGKSNDPGVQSVVSKINKSLSTSHKSADDPEFYVCHHKQLKDICLYPVKSCGAFKVKEWQVGPRGLMFDREWMVVTESGIAMSQKREKNLCLIKPYIDLDAESLTLTYPGMAPITISMKYTTGSEVSSSMCNSKVCGDRVQSLDCGQEVADWLSDALQRPGCRLLRQKQNDARTSKLAIQGDNEGEKSQLSLANECQYLLISHDSVRALQEQILQQFDEHFDLENLEDRFRANLIMSGCESFEEDNWLDVQIGVVAFKSQGVCTRCQMVCLDQQTGDRNKSPLQVLTTWTNRKTSFGVLLCSDVNHDAPIKLTTIKVGDPVFVG